MLRILCLSLLITISLYSQERNQTGNVIVLENSDLMVGSVSSEGRVRDYTGNVSFIHGRVYVTCQKAKQFLDANRAILSGDVVVTQDDMVLKAPRVYYNGNTGIAEGFEGVVITDRNTVLEAEEGTYSTETRIADFRKEVIIDDDSARIYADRIVYNRNNRNSDAYGNVWIFGKFTNSILNSDTVFNSPSRNYTFATGNPLLYQIDTLDSEVISVDSIDTTDPEIKYDSSNGNYIRYEFDTLNISCDTMEAFRKKPDEYYVFTGNVEIVKSELTAKCDFSEFHKAKNYISLEKIPVLWFDSTQLYSDSTVIYIEDDRPRYISAFRNAFSGSRDDTIDIRRINQLAGDVIEIHFKGDSIKKVAALGNSRSLYFLSDEESSDGANQNAADTIFVNFFEGEPDNIIWLHSVDGKMFPENQVGKNPPEYYLPEFKWQDMRPKMKYMRKRNNIPY